MGKEKGSIRRIGQAIWTMDLLEFRDEAKRRGVTIWSHEPSGMGRIVSAVEAHLEVL
jgi:hypothetical protein